MSDTKSSCCDDCDGGGMSLVIEAAATTTSTSSSGKYGRFWRRTIYVSIFISRKKTTHDHHVSSSVPYYPSPPSPVSSDPLPRTSSGKYGHLSSSVPYVPLPPSPVSSGPLLRTSSSQSRHAIDMDSDNEEGEVDKQQVLRIVKEKDLDLLKNFGGVEKVASVLGSHLRTGIDEGQISQLWNTNPVSAKGFIYYFVKGQNSSTIVLLFLISGFSFAVEMIEQGPQYGWHDGVAILIAILLLVTFRSVSNFLRERELEKKKLKVEVVRNGEPQIIPVSDVVVGDLVCLKKGDMVPADGLFVKGDAFYLDQAVDSKIDYETNPFLCSGSKVIRGHGHMLAISAGATTAYGDSTERTLLQAQIEKLNSWTENLGLFVSVLIGFVVLIGLLSKRQHNNDDILPELKGNVSIDLLMEITESMFWRPRGRVHILTGILTAIVIGMQHGMPFVITVSLSYWNEKVESFGVKPQNLSACCTMGLVTVICINATGDIMCNQMEVNKFFIGEEDMDNDVHSEIDQAVLEALLQGIGVSTLVPDMSVSPLNGLLAAWANSRWNINMELLDQCFSVLDHGSLRSNKNICRVLMKKNEEILHLHLNGDALTILNLCSRYYDSKGEIHDIQGQRRNLEQVIEKMENQGLRVIAFACKQIESPESSEVGSCLLAVVGLKYSCQETVEALRHAGVSIKLVSQDELSAARGIACKLGISCLSSDHVELEGEQIRGLNDTERTRKIEKTIVMGSCLSEDKLCVVKSLEENGHVVAFIGGLKASDTPALKKADVGIRKEILNTDIARESCDIVISDEHSLIQVLKFGRCAYNNIQKFTQLQLTACISGLLINLVAAICLWDSPLTAIQLIWVNFAMCLLGGLMMVMELRSEELMANPPAKRTELLLTKAILKEITTQVISQTSLLLILHLVGKVIHSIDEDIWKSLVFNSFMLCQIFNQFKAMGILRKEIVISVLHHHWFLLAFGAVMAMQVLIFEFGIAGCERLNLVHWALCFIISAISWGFGNGIEFISVSFSNWFSRSYGSNLGFSRRRPFSLVSFSGIPLPMIFLFSLSYYFYPDKAQVFRR